MAKLSKSPWPGRLAALQEQALPALLAAYPSGRAMRARVAGCSTGEEAYSLAIAFKEVLDLTIQAFDHQAPLSGMALLVFADIEAPPPETGSMARRPARGSRGAELERALQQAREETQAIREEMQTSREELKSTNEELQPTNEELTASKEEMQSLNEELQTVNIELQSKVDELSAANNDMKNLLNSTDVATVFLDNALCVRRFTVQATRISKLIPSDIGVIQRLQEELIRKGQAMPPEDMVETGQA